MNVSLQQTRFRVEGMDCASCAAKIDIAARRIAGIEDVSVSVTAGTMTVQHAPESDLDDLQKRVTTLGYKIAPLTVRTDAVVSKSPACDHDHNGHHHDSDHGHAHGQNTADKTGTRAHDLDQRPSNGPWWKSSKARLTIVSGMALAIAYAVGLFAPSIGSRAFIAAMLIGLVPIARRAVIAARFGTPFTIETLMTIAAVGAVFIGASEEAAAVVFLFLIGELLEGVAAGKARDSIQSLTMLVPKTAFLDVNGQIREVPAEILAIGATILVRPGDRIPADGVIVAGDSQINEAPVTGESIPVHKGPGATVFAGTVNGDAALRLRVTAAAADNTIARVVRLVEEAQEAKAPTERLIDRFSRYYTPAVMAVAALVAIAPPMLANGAWSEWIYKGLAILLIGCPCALVISVPASIAASLAAGARRGLLLKGGAVLENIGQVSIACFDKTGTLTEGKPKVTDVIGFDRTKAEVLELAATVETGSSHPLATAILAEADAAAITPRRAADVRAISGKGVTGMVDGAEIFLGSPQAVSERAGLSEDHTAQITALNSDGKTVAVLASQEQVLGLIAMRDEPRADAAKGLAALARLGVKAVMLTGDNRRVAEAIGKQLGIEVRSELMPQDKLQIVGAFKDQGFKVAKIGDGINDAPALAAADVGVAMGGGTDVALETADAAILHGRVGDVAAMIELSRRATGNIRQNFSIALGLKAVFLVTTVVGLTGLWPAILADTGATVLVTLNAMRLLQFEP